MIATQDVRALIEVYAQTQKMFVVDVSIRPDNTIEVEVDRLEGGVTIDDCAALTHYIEANFDKNVEDYELMVCSPGLGRPLKVKEQYPKLYGEKIEVLLKAGEKINAVLCAATDDSIEIEYKKKQVVEGKKGKRWVQMQQKVAFADIKTVRAIV
ncbi:hypothetical protein FACS189456_0480 [Bacteroidia bacterium]|nr:hypothetical protein FACS189456_0480 [Bacteroidia bacterium]